MSNEFKAKEGSENLFLRLKLVKKKNEVDFQGMMGHILQCLMALKILSNGYIAHSNNLVFREAVLLVLEGSLVDHQFDESRINYVLDAISPSNDKSKKPIWYPLDWALLLCDTFGEIVVQDIYDDDPMALSRPKDHMETYINTSARIFCASEVLSQLQLTTLNGLIIRNPKAFTMNEYGFGVLHVLAIYGHDLNLLQSIIQLAPREVSTKFDDGFSPLGLLIENRFLESDEWFKMVECLLKLDNSPLVVFGAVSSCFSNVTKNSTKFNRQDEAGKRLCCKALHFIEMILNNCPDAVTMQDNEGVNLLCAFLKAAKVLRKSFVLDLIKVIISVNSEILQQLDNHGMLPVHYAAQYAVLSCVSFLVDEYPGAATVITRVGNNILHCAMLNPSEEVITYLCDRYPELNLLYNHNGSIPLHIALTDRDDHLGLKFILCICSINPEVVTFQTMNTENLPLYLLTHRYRFGF